MKIIGLTGSIGMGKSATAAMLRLLRIPVHDSDAAVHRALAPGGDAFRAVALAFPEAWDKKTHTINRTRLGEIVFNDTARRKTLEAILHPCVWLSQKKFILKHRRMGARKVVLDIPLLYETGAEKKCDAVISVTAPYFIQRLRVLRRPGMTEEKFLSILASQAPDAEKRRRADWVVNTGLGRAFVLEKLRKILR